MMQEKLENSYEVAKIRKINKSRYEVTFTSGTSIVVLEDVALKYRLVKGNIISENQFNMLEKENEYYLILSRCIKYSSMGYRSKNQIKMYLLKLQAYEYYEKIISELERLHLINDLEFAYAYSQVLYKKGYGPKMIEYRLKNEDLDSSSIEAALSIFSEKDYLLMMEKLLPKLEKNYKKLEDKKRKIKIMKYFEQKGFTLSLIYKLDCAK